MTSQAVASTLAQVFLHASNLWPAAAIVAVMLAGTTLYLYRSQLTALKWYWRIVLPGLRLLGFAALSLSILKPVAERLAKANERDAIIVLVDRSRSMEVVDNTRTPAQLVALADALGKLPAGVRGDSTGALVTGLERLQTLASNARGTQEDLDYARVSGRDIQFRQKRLEEAAERFKQAADVLLQKSSGLGGADELIHQFSLIARPPESASHEGWHTHVPEQITQAVTMVAQFQSVSDDRLYESNAEVRSACEKVAMLSRWALVEQALLRPNGIVSNIKSGATVNGFAVASDLTPLTLVGGDQVVSSFDAAPDGSESNLTGAIARAVEGRAVRAVILFSDGRQVGGDATIVSGLTPNGVPIFTVSAAAADPPRDVSFASISAPASVFAGQSITIKTELRHDGIEGDVAEVHCQIGDEHEEVKRITLQEGKRADANFSARLTKPGVQRVRLWFPRVKGEASADNNHAERWIKVVPERMKVMMVAGSPTWDFQYVRNALSRLPEVQLKDIVLDPVNPRLPISPQEVLSQDVILLFDVPVAGLDEKHWDAVDRVAQVAGGSVILVAGQSHLPGEYYKLIPTSTLLPFRAPFKPAWRVWPGEEAAFHFVPVQTAESLDVMRLPNEADTDSEHAPRRWEQLPGFFKFLQLPKIHDEKWKPQARPLLVEEESRLPVLTEMRLGSGRAFFLGFNETWRWRLKVGERDQEHFWKHLIEYASEDPYFAHEGPLSLDTDKVSAEPGEAVHVRARDIEESVEPALAAKLQVFRGKNLVSEQPLSPAGVTGNGRFLSTLALPVGDYEIRWSSSGADHKPHTVRMPLHIASTSEAELADLSGDRRMLRKLSEASGGEFLTLEQVDRLPERLAAAGDARSRYAEVSLWDSPYLFVLVIGCFGAEWALRKRVGLA